MSASLTPTRTAAFHPGADAARRTALARFLPYTAAALVWAVCALVVDNGAIGSVRDDAMYVVLAKSLATGHGFSWLNLPGAPAATHFPPGYPAVLALLWLLFPSFPANVVAFKLANAVFSAIAAYGVARMLRARFDFSDVAAQLFAVSALLAAPTITLGTMVMSEPLFLALLVPILMFAERLAEEASPGAGSAALLGALAGAATLVRTYGIAIVGAAVVILVLRRHWRAAAMVAGVALLVLAPWQLWVAAHSGVLPTAMRGNYESYGAWLVDGVRTYGAPLVARTVRQTSTETLLMLQYVVAPAMPAMVRLVALVLALALSAVGARVLWRRAPITTLFLAMHTLIVLLWPYTPGRFVWAVWPLVLLLPVLGARALLVDHPLSLRWPVLRRVTAVAASVLAIGYAAYNVQGYRGPSWSVRGYQRYLAPIVATAAALPPDAVIQSESEGSVYLYTGRRTVPVGTFTVNDYFHRRTAVENAAVVREIGAHYQPSAVIVASAWYRAAARELVIGRTPELRLVDTLPGGGWLLTRAAP